VIASASLGLAALLVKESALVAVSLGTALRLLVVPWGQTIDYGRLRESVARGAPVEWAWLIGCFALVGWLRQGGVARADARFGLAWLGVAVLPVASLLPIGFLAAERALYLPRAGFAIAAAALANAAIRGAASTPARRERLAAIALAGVAALGVAASGRVAAQWRTPLTLWSHSARAHPLSPKAHAALAVALLTEAGSDARDGERIAAARREAERCLELNPDSGAGHYALGLVAEREGRPAEAARLFAEAARIEPSLRRSLQWRP
jgi:tetratricopeptide (TPR) repeat protein